MNMKEIDTMEKIGRGIGKWGVSWILWCFFLLFFANIYMHLSSVQRSNNSDDKVFTLQEYQNCEIGEDGQYIHSADTYLPMQLYYSIDNPSEDISQICIDFAKPINNYVWLMIYYSEDNTVRERLVPGLNRHVVDVEPGKYHEMRIDFDQSLYIKDVHVGEHEKIMLYADKVQRHRIWGICFIASFCLSVLLYLCKAYRSMLGKLCQNVIAFGVRIYSYIDIRKILTVLLGGGMLGGCLEGIVMLLTSQQFNGKEEIVFSTVGIVLLSFFVFRDAYVKKLELVSLVIYLLLGSVFICVIPVSLGISWDDDTHYYRIISMARFPDKTITEADDVFIAKTHEAVHDQNRYQRDRRRQNEHWYNEKYQKGSLIDNEWSFYYRDVPYLPFVVGIWVAYGLGLSFCSTALLAKIFQMILIGILLYSSIKNIRSGKLLILVFAMVPTVFFLTVSYSYDSWLIFFLIYAFSRYFGELQRKDEKLTFVGFCRIFVPAFLGLLSKIVYAPMLFLMVYMPKGKWKEKKWRIAYHACFVCAALIAVFGIWYVASGKMSMGTDVRASIKANGNQQLQYIIHHFGTYCHTLFAFLQEYFSGYASVAYLTNLADMGMLDMQYITILLLIITALWDRSSLDRQTIPVFSKVAAVVMQWIIAAICATIMYIEFTRVGADWIYGCQGRYLLPTIFPMLYMLSRFGSYIGIRKKIPVDIGNMVLIFLNVCFLLFHLWYHCGSKY